MMRYLLSIACRAPRLLFRAPPVFLLHLAFLHSTSPLHASLPSVAPHIMNPSSSVPPPPPPPHLPPPSPTSSPPLDDQYTAISQSAAIDVLDDSATSSLLSSSSSSFSLSSLLQVCVDGRCSRRLTWEEIVLIVSAGRLEALGRLDYQLIEYATSKKQMMEEYHTVVDRLRELRLGAPCRIVEGKKKCDFSLSGGEGVIATPASSSQYEVKRTEDGRTIRVCWYPNEFGYAMEEGIEHHLAWSDQFLSPDSQIFRELLAKHRPESEWSYVVFINPPHLRSIPDLHHIHCFSKRKSSPGEHQKRS